MDIATISTVIAASSVVVGVVFAILQLRDLAKTRKTDLVMRLYSTFDSREFLEGFTKILTIEIKDFNDYLKKYGMAEASEVFLFFEEVGILYMMKLIDLNLVNRLLGDPILMTWEKGKPLVEGFREYFHNPGIFWQFEYLYNEIRKRQQTLPQTQL
jgi:hypothetical protein